MLDLPDRSWWAPDSTDGAELVGKQPDGSQQFILQRLRLEQAPSGALRRARDLLPASRPGAAAQPLPERLGGGYLFVTSGSGSSLWRARSFLSRLTPLARLSTSPVQAVAGTDRILVRVLSTDRVWGVDPDTGTLGPPLPLPAAPRYGAMAFVDGWRGVVHADLRGLLATRDAGATWKPVPVAEVPRSLAVEGDLIAMTMGSGRLRFDPATGALLDGPAPGSSASAPAAPPGRKGVWGAARPLRVAVEDGWPLLDGTAVVLRGGRVARVKLEDGEVLDSSFSPLDGEEATTCQAIRFGADVGFACGAAGRGTTIHAYAPPAGVVPVLSFDEPRAVAPSQNGWLVLRGGCAASAAGSGPGSAGAYCVVSPAGALREVFTRGDVGVERVVALADGRVAVVVPPRGPTDGQVTILPAKNGDAVTSIKLQPGDEAPLLRRGLWLDGMYEAAPGEIGGWVEASGLLSGVRIKLADAALTAGPLQDGALFSITGTHAMAAQSPDLFHESLDGGLTWKTVDPPPSLGQGKLQPGLRCGAVGCSFQFDRGSWLRVGWGALADPTDLDEAHDKPASYTDRTLYKPLRLGCEIAHQESIKETDSPPDRPRRPFLVQPPSDASDTLPSFLGAPPPAVPAGALALSEGTSSGASARVYGWVPRGVAAGRASRIVARFHDRFDPDHPVRSTALSVASWRDEQALRDAFGRGNNSLAFHGLLDPGGKALLLSACQSASCDLFSAVDGRPLTLLPQPEGEPFARIFSPSSSAVWLDESFFLAANVGPQIHLWRLDPGQPRLLARIPRVTGFNNISAQVTLVRRARGGLLGLLARGAGVPNRSEQDLFILPIDPSSGQTGEPIRLGSSDLSWAPLRTCSASDDGWLIEQSPPTQPALRLPPGLRLGDVELRLRADPESLCVEALAARLLDSPSTGTFGAAFSTGFSPIFSSVVFSDF